MKDIIVSTPGNDESWVKLRFVGFDLVGTDPALKKGQRLVNIFWWGRRKRDGFTALVNWRRAKRLEREGWGVVVGWPEGTHGRSRVDQYTERISCKRCDLASEVAG